jgi:Mg/Co/Ni transporter MgtE
MNKEVAIGLLNGLIWALVIGVATHLWLIKLTTIAKAMTMLSNMSIRGLLLQTASI